MQKGVLSIYGFPNGDEYVTLYRERKEPLSLCVIDSRITCFIASVHVVIIIPIAALAKRNKFKKGEEES